MRVGELPLPPPSVADLEQEVILDGVVPRALRVVERSRRGRALLYVALAPPLLLGGVFPHVQGTVALLGGRGTHSRYLKEKKEENMGGKTGFVSVSSFWSLCMLNRNWPKE